MGGALSALYEGWRAELIRASALIESAIDFADEADVASDAWTLARTIVAPLVTAIRAHLEDDHRGEILREGFRAVLAGPPNVGKSSLLNALARRDAAIVSEEAGTTRDVIEVRLDLEGLPVVVSDTAGIREAQGSVELEGIRRTLAHARAADLVVWICDATMPATEPPPELRDRVLLVANKIDLAPDWASAEGRTGDRLGISARTGTGIEALTINLAEAARERIGVAESPAITRARYRTHLGACMAACEAFMASCREGIAPCADDIELRAEDLRQAIHALGRITGRVDVEEVLGEIFGRFCIGK